MPGPGDQVRGLVMLQRLTGQMALIVKHETRSAGEPTTLC